MKMHHLLVALLVAACGGDEPTAPIPTLEDVPDTVDVGESGIVVLDAGPDPVDVQGFTELAVTVTVPRCAPESPCPFRVRHEDPSFTGPVEATVEGELSEEVQLYRGQGSGVMPGLKVGTHELTLVQGETARSFEFEVVEREIVTHEGLVDEQNWAADVIHHVTDHLSIDGAFRLSPGAIVVVAPGANIEVSGAMTALGSGDFPVLFTSEAESPWGGLRLIGHATSSLTNVFFTGGGGDPSKSFGHSDSQPVIRIKAGTLEMTSGAILDSPGKALGCSLARVELQDVLVARVDTGGELDRCAAVIEAGHVSEIPDGDGIAEDDDNDGIYLLDVFIDENDLPVQTVIRDSVFFLGEDDGIDHNNALVRVEDTWIEGFAHEGVAASVGNTISIVDSVIRGCEQGVEAGYGSPNVEVDHCLITENYIGIRFGDSYDWDTDGTLTVSHTVSVENEANVRNYLNATGAPHPDGLSIACSMVDDAEWDGVANNQPGVPVIMQGCVEAAVMDLPCDGKVPGPTACE